MMDGQTHTVTITVTDHYPHGLKQYASVTIGGDGQLDHMFEAFKAALVAAGFALETAKKLDDIDL
jgi:hypothetical protein